MLPLIGRGCRMPRYYFNIRDGHDVFDKVGTELSSIRDVRLHMMASASALIEKEGDELPNHGDWEMEALDEQGKIICTMAFAVTRRPR